MNKLILLALLLTSSAHARSAYQVQRVPSTGGPPQYGAVDISQSAAVTGILPNARTTATSANTSSTIVLRDSSGNFSCGTITAALTGNASTATALAANPTDCGANTFATTIDASGNLTCAAVSLTAAVSGVLPIANGGTSLATLTAHAVYAGNGTAAPTPIAPGSSGNVMTSNGTDWISAASTSAPTSSTELYNVGVTTSVSSNALTIALKQADASTNCSAGSPCKIGFRGNAGAYNERSVTGSLSLTVPSGTTIGTRSATNEVLYVYAIDNSGTVALGVTVGAYLDEASLPLTTAISGGSSRSTFYASSALGNKAIRLIGKIYITETTAGTWASNAADVSVPPFLNDQTAAYADFGGASSLFRVGYAAITNNGTAAIGTQLGDNWVSSVSRTGTGTVTINVGAGVFSAAPICFMTSGSINAQRLCQIDQPSVTTTAVPTQCYNTAVGADIPFTVMCVGLR